MASPLIVIVLVGGATTSDATTHAISTTLESSLDPGSTVVLAQHRGDVDLTGALASAHADAAASVVWSDPLHAHLRVVVPATRTTAERDVVFTDQDAPEDRGRTVGFLLSTLVSPSAPSPQQGAGRTPDERPPSSGDRARTLALDASFAAAGGVGGEASAYGGELGARYRFVHWAEVRAGAMLGAGSVAPADASSTTVRLKAGAIIVAREAADRSSPSIALRLDLVAVRHALSTTSGSESRWVPCASPSLEVAWRVAGAWSALVVAGAEVAAGRTTVLVGDEQRATIPILRIVGNAGVKADF